MWSACGAIVVVGLVYSIALRAIWHPTGWQAVADHALHDATPPLFFVAWLASEHGALRWRDLWIALAAPSAYCIYALTRGAFDGWYAYWFLDPRSLSAMAMVSNIALLLAVFLAVAAIFNALDRWLGAR